MNTNLFSTELSLTFDDVLVVPGYTEVLPNRTDVSAFLTPDIKLNIPILSAAMDTVTEARLAIALAREGGLGIIHRNLSPIDQAAEVDKVKRSQSGMIVEPITLPPDAILREAEEIMSTYHISGVPIVEEGGILVGILTNRDVRFVEPADFVLPVYKFMTSENLVTAPIDTDLEAAKSLLQKYRIEKLPLVDNDGVLKGLITVKDIHKARDFPKATVDHQGRLLVGAAVGVGADLEDRVQQLVAADLDMVVIDTAHGHSEGVIQAIQRVRYHWPELAIVAGNVVTGEGTQELINAGVSSVKVGVGAGSICTTRIVSGAGMPQLSAIYNCAQVARKHGVSIIADGGIKFSGDIVKAIVAGADLVMLGSLLAGLEESPGDLVLYEGRHFKEDPRHGQYGCHERLWSRSLCFWTEPYRWEAGSRRYRRTSSL